MQRLVEVPRLGRPVVVHNTAAHPGSVVGGAVPAQMPGVFVVLIFVVEHRHLLVTVAFAHRELVHAATDQRRLVARIPEYSRQGRRRVPLDAIAVAH